MTELKEIGYILSPETNRPIKIDGPTYQKLSQKYDLKSIKVFFKPPPQKRQPDQPIAESHLKQILEMPIHQYDLNESQKHTKQPYLQKKITQQIERQTEARGSANRGWAADSPKRGTDRHLLKEKCGDRCFLVPETEAFPICPRCVDGICQCELDCRSLPSAKSRAQQHKYTYLAPIIEQIQKSKCYKNNQK